MKRIALTLIFVLCCSELGVGSNQGGTESPFVLGAGARDLSMGGAVTAGSSPATAPFWNASLLARAERYCFSGFHSGLYESDIAYQYLGMAFPTLDMGTLGLGVFRLGVNNIERRDYANLLTGDYDDTRMLFLVAYGKSISGYELGAALSMEHHSIETYTATSTPGLSLSLSRRFVPGWHWLPSVAVAANGRNLIKPGTELADVVVKQPTALEFGLETELSPMASWNQSLTLAASVRKVDKLDATVSAGLEYNFSDLLYLRGGVRDSRLSFGAGVGYRLLSFDYALVDRDLGSLHMFTLTTTFGKSVTERRAGREQQREKAFNSLMNERMNDRNRAAAKKLVEEGKQLLSGQQYDEANNRFERALFLARSAGLDTVTIHELASEAQTGIDVRQRRERYDAALSSADHSLEGSDYLSARHYASLALAEDSTSEGARAILKKADAAIERIAAKDGLIRTRLLEVDSLLSYGHVAAALEAVRTLRQFAQEDPGVQLAVKRVEFEQWKERATQAFALRDFGVALAGVDSALVRFPGHQWCIAMRERIVAESRQSSVALPVVTTAEPMTLSADLQREVEAANREAQKAFENGNLQAAITNWERVERIAPNYQSVRTYLVNAYKYVGVELYGKNMLADAVVVWRKAAGLAPDNVEIQEYIRRTENEISRLNELSYDR
jgi:tetratricopeptide (TPR) repeat protein